MARSSNPKMISVAVLAVLILSMLAACAAPAAPVAPTAAPAQPTAAPAQPTTAPAEPTAAPAPTTAPEPTKAPEPTAAPTEAPAASGEPVHGGTLIVGSPQEPETLNPVLSSQTIADAVSSLVIEGLVEIDADGKYVPVMAETLPEVSDDGLTVTYTLKKDLKWSNGDPVTCEDVKFTYDVIMGDLSQVSTSGYKDIDGIECEDGGKVAVTFAKLYAPYLRLFSYIIPQSAGDPATLDSWEYNRMPVGTGPWVLKEWKAGDQMVFEKNPNYRVEGQPYLDGVIIKILPSREVGMQLIGTGEIDALWDLIEADFPALEEMKDEGVTWASAVTGENELILFNFGDPKVDAPADASKNPHPILGDLKVRQAFQMGIDKALIVETLLGNKVKVGTTVLPVGQFACPQEPSMYDPEAAKDLLEEAGWTAGSDGIREKDGVRLSLKYQTTSGNKLREDTQQVIVEMLKEIGIELTIENVPSDVLFAGWDSNGLRKHGNFDVIMYTTGPGIDPDSHLFGNYHSASIPTADNGGSGSNYSRWANATVDKAIDDASAVTDPAERGKQYCVVASEINKDLPRLFLYERLSITGVREDVQNFRVSPGPRDFTTDSATWWVKK